jgi:exodeoxyribonuclease VII small subunit
MTSPTELTFEQAREQLAAVVERLQAGTDTLQESLDLWERGELLAQRCEEFLAAARERVEEVVARTRGVRETDGQQPVGGIEDPTG